MEREKFERCNGTDYWNQEKSEPNEYKEINESKHQTMDTSDKYITI